MDSYDKLKRKRKQHALYFCTWLIFRVDDFNHVVVVMTLSCFFCFLLVKPLYLICMKRNVYIYIRKVYTMTIEKDHLNFSEWVSMLLKKSSSKGNARNPAKSTFYVYVKLSIFFTELPNPVENPPQTKILSCFTLSTSNHCL